MVKITKNIVNRTDRIYGHNNKKKFITVHETANTDRGADAATHGRLQQNGFSASWHYSVDDKQAVQSFPHTAQCWHAGDGRGDGNLNSIGIEICVNSDGDFKKAVENAAALVKKIMDDENISASNVVQHNNWSGKDCPHNLRSGSKGVSWSDFKAMLSGKPAAKPDKPAPKPKPSEYKGGSIVNYLNSIGVDSSTSNRKKLAKEYGVKGYDLSAKKNTELLAAMRKGKPAAKPKKSIAQMAKEVIAGKHGNGHNVRRNSLGISQAEYNKVRAEVNKGAGSSGSSKPKKPKKSIAQMAKEVAAGKHGNGHANRRKSLGITQAEYNKVSAEVNKGTNSSKSKKSVSQMASEVIAGKHGNGHANRRKSLGISQAEYNKVKAEVNKRA